MKPERLVPELRAERVVPPLTRVSASLGLSPARPHAGSVLLPRGAGVGTVGTKEQNSSRVPTPLLPNYYSLMCAAPSQQPSLLVLVFGAHIMASQSLEGRLFFLPFPRVLV